MIPVNEPVLGKKELAYVRECIETGWISSAGRFINAFEEAWATYCDRRYGVAVSSGTAALQLAINALNLKPGDEVIIPSFTIISCASAVILNQGVPVLVDVDPETWGMDVNQVEAKITAKTRAIMPVHIYGHPVDMDKILALAERYGLAVIEDAAEAHGAEYKSGQKWRRCGSFGTTSIFSFYANKIITTGEGGMLLTDQKHLAERFRSLRNLCFQADRRFLHQEMGHNYRMTNLQAAVGLAQVERIDEILARKREIGQAYLKNLQDLPGLQCPAEKPWAKNVYWMFAVLLSAETGLNAQTFAEKLSAYGVQTRPFFLGMHEQPVFQKMGYFLNDHHPVTERIARQGLYLPSGLALSDDQINEVSSAVRQVLK